MRVLTILDASAIVHTGEASNRVTGSGASGFVCNGLLRLNRQIAIGIKQGDIVIAFDSPSFRNDLMPDYKSGRCMNASVVSQLVFAYEHLNDAGFNCAKYDGYEADDIVDWASKLRPNYDIVTIVGNDYDLCHSIDDSISFQACNSLVNDVHSYDFCQALNQYVGLKYNTLSAYKVFNGCNSDKISKYKTLAGVSGAELYRDFNKFVETTNDGAYDNVPVMQKPELLQLFMLQSDKIKDEDYPELLRRIQLVYPAAKPDDIVIKPVGLMDTRRMPFIKYLTLLNDTYALQYLGLERADLTDTDYKQMRDLRRSVTSGAFAADMNIPADASVGEALELDVFSRDF